MSYLESCIDVANSINPYRLATLKPGEVIGSGSQFTFRPLGRLMIGGHNRQYVGLKSPRKRQPGKISAADKLISEMASISLYTSGSPDLLPKMPAFMCLLKIKDTDHDFILTEDASEGGAKKVLPRRTLLSTRELLYEQFKDAGSSDDVLDKEVLDMTTAFSVEGVERLLDFTPDPVKTDVLYMKDAIGPHIIAAVERIEDLTLTIPAISPLGKLLLQ
jgi:hypothetical protein